MVCLATNTPEYYAELCDEVRFFLDERKIPLVEAVQEEGYTVWHSVVEKPDAGCSPRRARGALSIPVCYTWMEGKLGSIFLRRQACRMAPGGRPWNISGFAKEGPKLRFFAV